VRCLPRTVVSAAGDETVGYMFWEAKAVTATLASIHVKPDHRRRAIGRALLARFEEDAARVFCEVADLHVCDGNPAKYFSESAGYRAVRNAAPYTVLAKELGDPHHTV
jgi:ribosomal protein S18 acetylase RimI-like enzyme